MNLSVLDAFILSLLDRGLETPYDLQRQGGLSLGASTPELLRLVKAELVKRAEGASSTNRPRHQYQLTTTGKREARAAWKPFLNDSEPPPDISRGRNPMVSSDKLVVPLARMNFFPFRIRRAF